MPNLSSDLISRLTFYFDLINFLKNNEVTTPKQVPPYKLSAVPNNVSKFPAEKSSLIKKFKKIVII